MDKDKITELEEENRLLRQKLSVCVKWMRREVEDEIHKIAKRKVSKLTEGFKEDFFQENQDIIMSQRIQNYFGDILLLNAPSNTLEYLVHSEINYFNFQKNPSIDGFTVISSYHKILDEFIEHFITMDFRKFAIKKNCTILRVNDPLEKALHLVINKKYILSLGRLFGLIREIKSDSKLYTYGDMFSQYLDKHIEIKDMLLNDNFISLFKELIDSEVFGSKRHAGKIGLEETKRTRELMTGEFSDKNSLLYIMLESQSILY